MEIRKVENPDGITLFLEGKFTFADREKFHEVAFLYPKENVKVIVLDCLKLETMDSNGVGMLLILNENANTRGVTVQAINVGKHVRPLFEHSALGNLFDVKYQE